MRLTLCTRIRHSIGTENLVPKEVNYSKIAIRMTVMNKVQFLLASEPRKPLEPRSLNVIFLVEKDSPHLTLFAPLSRAREAAPFPARSDADRPAPASWAALRLLADVDISF
jgi:hypothetical protein